MTAGGAPALPHYAVPLFVRLKAIETTGTFKYRKVDLKRDGFDPASIEEPLYWLASKDDGYAPLTREAYAQICGGQAKL